MKRIEGLSTRKIITFITLVIVTICIIVFMVGRNNITKDDTSNKKGIFGYWPVIVVTGSMQPAIEVNSINLCKTVGIEEIEIGEVVVFTFNDEMITHRVTVKNVYEDGSVTLRTKGDNNPNPDKITITEDMVLGKVVKTWNNTAPIISKYLVGAGEIDSLALAETFIWIVITIILCGIMIYGFVEAVIILVKANAKDKEFNDKVDTLRDDIERLNELVNKLERIKKVDSNYKTKFAKALAIKEIKTNSVSVDDLTRRLGFIDKLTKEEDKNENSEN